MADFISVDGSKTKTHRYIKGLKNERFGVSSSPEQFVNRKQECGTLESKLLKAKFLSS